MELYLQTASLPYLQQFIGVLPFSGIYCTPGSVAMEKGDGWTILNNIDLALKADQKMFAWVVKRDYNGMIKEATELENASDDLIVCLPCTREGFQAMAACQKLKIHVCATACFTYLQAICAGQIGVEYVELSMSELAENGDPTTLIRDIHDSLPKGVKIIASGLQNGQQARKAAAAGAEALVLTPLLLNSILSNPQSRMAFGREQMVWTQRYGSDSIHAVDVEPDEDEKEPA